MISGIISNFKVDPNRITDTNALFLTSQENFPEAARILIENFGADPSIVAGERFFFLFYYFLFFFIFFFFFLYYFIIFLFFYFFIFFFYFQKNFSASHCSFKRSLQSDRNIIKK